MFVEIILGLLAYTIFKHIFYDKDGSVGVDASDTTALFSVAKRLEKLYGGKTFVGLRIPDQDTGLRENIDMVLVTDREVVVISVKNVAGNFSICDDGSWACEDGAGSKKDRLLDPIEETKKQALVLESYLERRDLALPEGYLSYKVVFPNPQFQLAYSSKIPPEVVTHDQWAELKPESKNVVSKWLKGAFLAGKKEMQESINEKLISILSTSPIWDRLELKNKHILGEFMEFKGKQDDLLTLRNVKRSKISRIVIQKFSMLGFAPSKLQVLLYPRDYRSDTASSSEWNEVTVSANVEVVFQPRGGSKVSKYKLSSIICLSLSA